MNRLLKLKQDEAAKRSEMKAIMDLCEKETRSRTADEKTKWEALKKECDDMRSEIEALEEQEKIDLRSAKPIQRADQKEERKEEKADELPTIDDAIRSFMKNNKAQIESIQRGQWMQPGEMPEFRAAATMTISQTNVGSSILLPNAGVIGGINDLNRTRPTFWQRLQKGSTDLNPYFWANKTNKQGSATFIGEGVLKPLASFEVTVEQSNAKKVAERFRVSTELLNDFKGMKSLIEDEARFELEVAANTATLTGTSSSTMPAGITTVAVPYSLTTVQTDTPTYLDAIRAAVAQLKTLNFTRNIVAFVNPVDAANMDLAKGTDGHYMLPPFTSSNGQTLAGIEIVEDNNIAVGNLLIGDISKYKILMVEGMNIKWGYDSDDFSKNLITMIAEMRFHQFVGANDSGAFIYDAFADIQAAIA